MKRLIAVLLTVLLVCTCLTVAVCGEELRAGGGGTTGGGGGGGGGTAGGSSYHHRRSSPFSNILTLIFAPFLLFGSAIFFWWQTTKRARKAKKLMKQMAESDNAWLFADIQAVVKEGFYAIQNAWAGLDMTPAAPYMSEALQEEFQTKLNWMKYRGERNVLQDIQLKKALPVAIYDDADNTKDQVWFYIKGKMIDYTVNEAGGKISGSQSPSGFVEYWQFVRRDDRWVLNKILQKNQSGQIAFAE